VVEEAEGVVMVVRCGGGVEAEVVGMEVVVQEVRVSGGVEAGVVRSWRR